MTFKEYFSNQARKPKGWFGRIVMSRILNLGNANLNRLVLHLLSAKKDDRIFEIGCGPGKLISELAKKVEGGLIEGIDFSEIMISIASKRNKRPIASGKVKLTLGDFDNVTLHPEFVDKVCSTNTLYFWPDPGKTLNHIADILKPGGLLILAFEDIGQLKDKSLDPNVFTLYSKDDVEKLIMDTGRFDRITTTSKKTRSATIHCTMANKV